MKLSTQITPLSSALKFLGHEHGTESVEVAIFKRSFEPDAIVPNALTTF